MQSKNLLYLKFAHKGQPRKVVLCFAINGVGLELHHALQLRGKAETKSSLLYPLVSFSWAAEGVLLTKRRPFRPQTPTIPTARSRGAIALSRRTLFKF